MCKWVQLECEEQLKERYSYIKKNSSGRILTNYQFMNSETDDDLLYTQAFFLQDGLNLTMFKKCDDIYKLYYFMGDTNSYKIVYPSKEICQNEVVCELIEKENKERQNDVVEILKKNGFCALKKYYLWECKQNTHKENIDSRLVFSDKPDINNIIKLYDVFDYVGDSLPIRKKFESYISKMEVLSLYDNEEFVGIIVYSVKGKTVTEEYLFIENKFRGTKYANAIQQKFQNICFELHRVNVIYGWVQENNNICSSLISKFNFIKTGQYKLTLSKRNEALNT